MLKATKSNPIYLRLGVEQTRMISKNKTKDHLRAPKLCSIFRLYLFVAISAQLNIVLAEDPTPPQLDLGGLANLASSLGGNPQIMGMVSSLFNQQAPKPPVGVISPAQSDLSRPEAESNSLVSEDTSAISNEPIKRATGQQTGQTASSLSAPTNAAVAKVPTQQPNPFSGLMSLLPNVLPGLNSGILSSLSGNKGPPQSSTAVTASAGAVATGQIPTMARSSTTIPADVSSPATVMNNQPSSNSAQAVINQVLTAYASGQIPSELIQLGLSGRVPASIVELALSGVVPQQIIQMVITGQIPIGLINAVLDTLQGYAVGSKTVTTSALNTFTNESTSGGILSTTRGIFEALFNRPVRSSGKDRSSITVPTLLGPVPIQLPNLPSLRKFGQMVGGTISNVSSLVPF